MDIATLAIPIAMALAWVNGANDNIKGAATLVGSGLSGARSAIVMATAATAAGGLVSLFLMRGLLRVFGGHGIVPDEFAGSAEFLVAVGLGAAATVALATRLGLPVSTTHALVGALLGTGLVAAPAVVQIGPVLGGMAMPLVLVPLAAVALALIAIPPLRRLRARAEQMPEACVCADPGVQAGHETALARETVHLGTAAEPACRPLADKALLRAAPARTLDAAHVMSALGVSFARGLNDTPKIAAIGLAGTGLGATGSTLAVVVAMALGGLLAARRVTETLAWRVAKMDAAEGLGGNLVTTGLVVGASAAALPVSTTHVSGGALFGIGAGNRSGHARTIASISLAWVLTLPLGALLAAMFYIFVNGTAP